MVDFADIAGLSAQIVRLFDPDKIILFGSYAYGNPGPYSDVDLLVILPFEGKSFTKSMEILKMVKPPFSVDLLARKPDDTARRYREFDPLIREAIDKGEVLYERDRKRVA